MTKENHGPYEFLGSMVVNHEYRQIDFVFFSGR